MQFTLPDGSIRTQAGDTVYTVVTTSRPLTKTEVERAEVEHYREVARRRYPRLAFEIEKDASERPSNESPDFFVIRNGRRIGLDVTDYAFSDRRSADARFDKVKQTLAAAYRKGHFRLGERMHIGLRFTNREIDPRELGQDLDDLIEQLDRIVITPGIEAFLMQGDVMSPARYPLNQSGNTSTGAIEWWVQSIIPQTGFIPGPQSDWFHQECRFQIEHQYADEKKPSDIADELNRIVAKHDKAKPPEQHIDELLIVAGGPDRLGRGLPGEAARVSRFVQTGGKIATPQRLTRIVLDCWGSDQLIVLFERE